MCGLHIRRNVEALRERYDICIGKSAATALGLAA
jgi:hypothetical protein